MKFTAYAMELVGVVIVGVVGYQHFGAATGSEGDDPSMTRLGLILGFAIALMIAGATMLSFGRKRTRRASSAAYERQQVRPTSDHPPEVR